MEGGGRSDPLLANETSTTATDVDQEQTGELVPADNGVTVVLAVATLAAVCGSYIMGNAQTYSSPAETGIRDDLDLSLAEYSVFGSTLNLGGLFGALCSGKLADLVGRRGAIWVTDVLALLGWLAIAFSQNAWMLDIGRLFLGLGIGIVSYVVPVYIAEITPKNLRGALVSLHVAIIGLGISCTLIIGVVVDWRILALLGTIPCVVQLLMLLLVPESPRWLAKVGRKNEVETALQKLRGKDNISCEARDIEVYTANNQGMQHKKIGELFQKKYARPLIVGLGAMTVNQLSGVTGYAYYMSSVLEKAGASVSAGLVAVAVLTIAGGVLSTFLMDIFGRRPLLLVSISGLCLGNCITGLSFLLQDYGWWTDWVPTLNFLGLVVFFGFYPMGTSPIPWILMSEIFPVNVKGAAGSIVTFVNWGAAWFISFTFNYLFEWNSAGVFFMFSGFCFAGIIFVAKIVPETKGRTLEEIQATLMGL